MSMFIDGKRASFLVLGRVLSIGAIIALIAVTTACGDVSGQGKYICANGTATGGTPGTTYDVEICIRCDAGYVLNIDDDICRRATYTCQHGTPAAGNPDSGTRDVEHCDVCHDGYALNTDNGICRRATYTCQHGTPAAGNPDSGTRDVEHCEVCDDGYVPDAGTDTCRKALYICNHGKPAKGNPSTGNVDVEHCISCYSGYSPSATAFRCDANSYTCAHGMPADGLPIIPDEQACASCDARYVLENMLCREARYICEHGTPIDASIDDGNHDVTHCIACDSGYTLNESALRCDANSYTCDNGMPADGLPIIPGEQACASCDVRYVLENMLCREARYICEHGTPIDASIDDGNHDVTHCIACDSGYTLNESALRCDANSYTCDNGMPADGLPIIPDEEMCASCDARYVLENMLCREARYICEHGTPIDASIDDGNHDVTHCIACDSRYTLNESALRCDANSYTCERGMPADGLPIIPDEEMCASCDAGYVLENMLCRQARYICSNGTPIDDIPDSGNRDVERCSECDSGYTMIGDTCRNFYRLSNGVTITCDDAMVGDTGVVDGVTYTKRTKNQITPDNAATTCTSGISDMSSLFSGEGAFNGDISHWDTSDVTTMNRMFRNAVIFNQDIGSWDTAQVTDMGNMFESANAFNQDIGDWETDNVMNMDNMFHRATYFNHDLSGWSVDNLSSCIPNNFAHLSALIEDHHPQWSACNGFYEREGTIFCDYADVGDTGVVNGVTYTKRTKNQITPHNAPTTCTSGITDMSGLFLFERTFNGDISHWDTSDVTAMSNMFRHANAFNQDISRWNMENVTNTDAMLLGASVFNQDISGWNMENVMNMEAMLSGTLHFNQDISGWNTENVTNMKYVFNGTAAFNQDISSWETGMVTNMWGMFEGATAFNQDISGWDVENVDTMIWMFWGAESFNQNLNAWCVPLQTSLPFNFSINSALSTANHPHWGECERFVVHSNDVTILCDSAEVGDTRAIDGVTYTKRTRNQITNANAATTCTSGITDMSSLFSGQSGFNGDISHWDTGDVTTMNRMFRNASSFNRDISSWDTRKVTDMEAMFQSALTFNHDIGDWETGNVTNMNSMFHRAMQFNQPLTWWCVTNILSEPPSFSASSALVSVFHPHWSRCPTLLL